MPITFFGIRGITHYEFVPPGQNVSQACYLEVLKRLREKVRRTRHHPFAAKSWILRVDSAPAHTALSVREFLASKQSCLNNGVTRQILPYAIFSVLTDKNT
jgi:hypothetical protein